MGFDAMTTRRKRKWQYSLVITCGDCLSFRSHRCSSWRSTVVGGLTSMKIEWLLASDVGRRLSSLSMTIMASLLKSSLSIVLSSTASRRIHLGTACTLEEEEVPVSSLKASLHQSLDRIGWVKRWLTESVCMVDRDWKTKWVWFSGAMLLTSLPQRIN